MLFGDSLPGVFSHAGMDVQRFTYIVAYTSEGVFGTGLKVAATYLFMFMMFGATLQATKTGDFIMKLANAGPGRQTGAAAKGAMAASAGLGTIVGSSVGNAVATGSFTIPLMVKTGFKRHAAAAVETNTSEGAQLVPPIIGTSAFIMAQITGISYATIAVAAIIPAFLCYLSLYWVTGLVLALAFGAAQAQQQALIGASGSGSGPYINGAQMADVANKSQDGIRYSVQTTGGYRDNLGLVLTDKVDLALNTPITLNFAYNQRG